VRIGKHTLFISIQPNIGECRRIVARFEMGEDRAVRHRSPHCRFDLLGHRVSLLDTPGVGHEKVKRDKAPCA
jgi:hypothetical protein